jgi:hypothetical protein
VPACVLAELATPVDKTLDEAGDPVRRCGRATDDQTDHVPGGASSADVAANRDGGAVFGSPVGDRGGFDGQLRQHGLSQLGGIGDIALAEASEQPSTDHEQRAEGQETAVVGPRVVHAFTDVVDREDLMVHDALNEVQ